MNNIKIEKFSSCNQNLFEIAKQIRTRVFIEEQLTPEKIEFDNFDHEAVHFLLFSNGKAVATARYIGTSQGYKLERFAVLKSERGNGYGKKIVNTLLDQVKSKGKRIYIHAQEYAVKFYQKCGFIIDSDVFIEANIRHFRMVYQA